MCTEDEAEEYRVVGKALRQRELLRLYSQSRTQYDMFGKQDEAGWAKGREKMGAEMSSWDFILIPGL